jgi:putative transposase
MPRQARVAPGAFVYHALNRAVARLPLFRKEADYTAFEQLLCQAQTRHPTRILAWCLMPNHWHFVLWPRADGELTAFVRWLAHTHAMRWHVAHRTVGCGHLYQGRFKSLPVQDDAHFLTVCRYVERNALTANLVSRAEEWRWGSLCVRHNGSRELQALLTELPLARPRNWVAAVNTPLSPRELEALRLCVARSRPFGDEAWQARTATRLGLLHTLRAEGRPRKKPVAETSSHGDN